ncbi:EamA family transporter [Cryptosporangium arvum]|uniref:EamA-like family transporter n=1 Tax=Cryptosporangium arvum DSM 44712 TaxID=927661 RepID=A0A010ZT34_9ACTN|nr:EamA family transporter [Cryptosporangium arvum]EXG80372.1 EamA-like family transporter [Cryptosporangium arvum DSM 44712]
MIPVLLAAGSALVYGVGDYCGGTAGKRAPAVAVTVVAKVSAFPLLLVLTLLLGADAAPGAADLGWAALAGLAGVGAVVLFYRAMSAGAMAVVAPVTAAASAVLPVIVGILVDGSPGTVPLIGVGCAVVAIALVSAGGGRPAHVTPPLVGLAVVAGIGFGLFFVLLDRVHSGVGQWPLVVAQVAAILALVVLSSARRERMSVPRAALPFALAAGAFDTVANVLYVLANNSGQLALVAPLASLYPASTVVLALVLDREKVRGWQLLGLGLAGTALALLAATG